MVHNSPDSQDDSGGISTSTTAPEASANASRASPPDRVATDGGPEAEATDEDEESFYEMYNYNFAWYFTKTQGWRMALKATALLLGSFVLAPLFVLLGYTYRVGRAAALGEESPPPLEDWKPLMDDGARFFVGGLPAILLLLIPIVGTYMGLALLTAYIGTDSATDPATYRRALRLMFSIYYLFAFVEYLFYVSALTIMTVLVIGVGWVLGPGFLVVSSGAFFGYVYHHAADREIVGAPTDGAS